MTTFLCFNTSSPTVHLIAPLLIWSCSSSSPAQTQLCPWVSYALLWFSTPDSHRCLSVLLMKTSLIHR